MFHILTGNLELLFSVNVTDEDYIDISGFIDNMVYGNFIEYDMRGNQTSL